MINKKLISNWKDVTSQIKSTEYMAKRTHLYVNENLKLAYLTVMGNDIPKNGVLVCTIPKKYAPILEDDHVWFIMWFSNGYSGELNKSFGRGIVHTDGQVVCFNPYTELFSVYGEIMYPIA